MAVSYPLGVFTGWVVCAFVVVDVVVVVEDIVHRPPVSMIL